MDLSSGQKTKNRFTFFALRRRGLKALFGFLALEPHQSPLVIRWMSGCKEKQQPVGETTSHTME